MEKLKEIVSKYKNIIAVLLTIFVAIGINVTFNKELNALKLDSSAYNIFYIIATIGVFLLIYYSFKIRDKRLWICSIILGLIFAICMTIGDVCNVYKDTLLPNSKKFVLYLLIKIVTYFILFTSIIAIALKKLPEIIEKWNKENKEYKYFTANKKSFWIIFGVFLISYIPFFLYYYPGNFQYDATRALDQIVGNIPYKDWAPIIYTLFLKIFWNLGKFVNNMNFGFAIYTLIQMICTALVLSYIIYYMAKKKVPTKYRFITFILLLVNPIIPMYTVRIEKSIYFALLLALISIQIIEIITNKNEYFTQKIHYFTFPIEILIMSLLRNNGIYIAILLFIILLILYKKYWKNLLLLLLVPIIIFYIIKGPIYKIFNIIPGDAQEALSIPVQQFARIIKYEKDNLSEQEYNEIHKYLNMTDEEITEKYVPTLSDNIKSNFNEEAFANDKIGLIELYIKLGIKFPGQTLSAFFINSFGYYAPNSNTCSGVYLFKEESNMVLKEFKSEEKIGLYNHSLVNFKFIEKLNQHTINKDIPILSIFIDKVGLYFWIILFDITYLIYMRKYKLINTYVPLLLLWLTTIIGPLVELRYVYTFLIFVIPLTGITLFYNIKGVENEKQNN